MRGPTWKFWEFESGDWPYVIGFAVAGILSLGSILAIVSLLGNHQ